MKFNSHSALEGRHALLSASQYYWLNYTPEQLSQYLETKRASQLGTQLHNFAAMAIKLGKKMPRNRQTLSMYINDAIGYRMTPELLLVFSPFIFGTADAVSFRVEGDMDRPMLRIHDLKTGKNAASMKQLLVYAALFCLEYDIQPMDIYIELRIYQNDEIVPFIPELTDIVPVMDKIRAFNEIILERMEEENA